jgi:flagellar motility protein MotE (MotC chaperone)
MPEPERPQGGFQRLGGRPEGGLADAPNPISQAERALLEQLRARRSELEAREQTIASRELVLAASERRLGQRIDELTQLQQRLESMERTRGEREESGWRGLVRTYESMRPREAAAIFEELELPVVIQILDRMGERKMAPVIGAMRPEKARVLTAELARHRANRPGSE